MRSPAATKRPSDARTPPTPIQAVSVAWKKQPHRPGHGGHAVVQTHLVASWEDAAAVDVAALEAAETWSEPIDVFMGVSIRLFGPLAEPADAPVLGTGALRGVGVQLPRGPPNIRARGGTADTPVSGTGARKSMEVRLLSRALLFSPCCSNPRAEVETTREDSPGYFKSRMLASHASDGGAIPSPGTMGAWWNGRHAGLRCRCSQEHGGSTPLAPTKHNPLARVLIRYSKTRSRPSRAPGCLRAIG